MWSMFTFDWFSDETCISTERVKSGRRVSPENENVMWNKLYLSSPWDSFITVIFESILNYQRKIIGPNFIRGMQFDWKIDLNWFILNLVKSKEKVLAHLVFYIVLCTYSRGYCTE